uniref:Uncharacterized protein n=1 Tax=Acrobeloides nanus TaxID=290746 RepID=A0A914E9Y0_9BILA
MNVAHGIHSITLRELRKLSPNITEDNRIPTINKNLSSIDPILLYAPDRKGPSDGKFMTDGMRTLDEVLSHMGDEAYDIKNSNTLERIVHAFHMEEAWAMVEQAYEKIRENPPNGQVCRCAMDIEQNGVLDKLRFIAMAIREPKLIYGDKKGVFKSVKKGNHMGKMPAYTYQFRKSQGNNQEKPAYTYQFRKSQENIHEKPAFIQHVNQNDMTQNSEKPAYTYQWRKHLKQSDGDKKGVFRSVKKGNHKGKMPAYTYQFRKSQENNQEKPAYAYQSRKSQENSQKKPAFIHHVNQNDMTQNSEKSAYTYQWRKHLEQPDDLNNIAFDQQLNKNTIFAEPKESLYPYRFKRYIDGLENNQEKHLPAYYFPFANQFKKIIKSNRKVQKDSLPAYYFPFTNQLKTMKKSQSENSTFKDQNQVLNQDNLLLRKDQSMPHFVGVNAWKTWKHISEMKPQEHVDAALFLYCALN